jgi:hypothetical protein
MKKFVWLILGLMISIHLLAEQTKPLSADSTVSNAPSIVFPPPSPLSKAAMEKIEKMTPIFDGQTLNGWKASVKGTNIPDLTKAWTVKDSAMASLGEGRGVLYTEKEYANYRLIFKMRHVSGSPDHQACVLIFCATPSEERALDALGGIQFQPPNGGSWDYRPGKNNNGKGLFTRLPHPKFDAHQWSQVELLVNADTGTARMAVAQPSGSKAYEVLDFKDPTAARKGPIGWQMHNKGLFDEYKDVRIEIDPKDDKLITTE